MTENRKESIIRCWKTFDKDTKIRIAAEFFRNLRLGEEHGDWWHFLDKKISTLTWNNSYCDT